MTQIQERIIELRYTCGHTVHYRGWGDRLQYSDNVCLACKPSCPRCRVQTKDGSLCGMCEEDVRFNEMMGYSTGSLGQDWFSERG